MRPLADRIEAWKRLALILDPSVLEDISNDIKLSEVVNVADDLISGKVRGRVVVEINQ
jgi:acrylyl-CoA reductase (NADPH)